MPLYELFALAKPLLDRPQKASLIRNAAKAIYAGGGVLMDIKSYDDRETAYTIRPPHQAYDYAFMWQLSFQAAPSALAALEHGLKVDDRMLRYVVHKRRIFSRYPTTHKVAKLANAIIQQQQQQQLAEARKAGTPLWWDPENEQDGVLTLPDPETGEGWSQVLGPQPEDPSERSPLHDSTKEWIREQLQLQPCDHSELRAEDASLIGRLNALAEKPGDEEAPGGSHSGAPALPPGDRAGQHRDAEAVTEALQPAAGTFPNPPTAEVAVDEQQQGSKQPPDI